MVTWERKREEETVLMLDIPRLFRDLGIAPRGVIHIGAHDGEEVGVYLSMGMNNILMIEANPNVFARLHANVSAYPQVRAVQCAISDRDGFVSLRVTSFDQSSSILPLKRHKDIYPDIREEYQISVVSRRLDTLLKEMNVSPAGYNFLNLDIQGAELMALQGAVETLQHIDAINTEINFDELYEGCALADEMDRFLAFFGFRRIATVSPYHPTWGDAFYVKG
jgi:FkbM family methyltransferase